MASASILGNIFHTSDTDFNGTITPSGQLAITGGSIKLTISFDCGTSTVTDTRDTNNSTYNTVVVGTQCWLARNENVGARIAGSGNQTDNSTLEKYCYSDADANCNTDGGLYQWAEAMQYKDGCSNTTSLQPTEPVQGICPAGWHVSSDSEQNTLDQDLKTGTCNAARMNTFDCDPAGTKLKTGGTSGMNVPLAGRRDSGLFYEGTTYAWLWSSSQYASTMAWSRALRSTYATVGRFNSFYSKADGFSIRCVKGGPNTVYYSSGTYTSPIFQRAQVASWGNMNWNATLNGQQLTIKARTCTYSDCHDRDWNCGDIDTGAAQGGAGVDLKSGSPNCVLDSQPYIQYQANFISDTTNTAYLNDILLDYQYNPDQTSMWGTVKFFGSITFK